MKNLETVHIVEVADIKFIKSDNNYSTFYLTHEKQIMVSKTLKHFEKKLVDQNFFRCHQRYLINLDLLRSYNKKNNSIIIKNNHEIPVSQSKKAFLIDYLNKIS